MRCWAVVGAVMNNAARLMGARAALDRRAWYAMRLAK
jgi:hypothetical protein